MSLAINFKAKTDIPGRISLSWELPVDFNETTDELIVTRTVTHYPVELFNEVFPDRATDTRPVEIFRGSTIVGLTPGTISVSVNTLTDTSATFPTSPSLAGRLLRDSSSKVLRIVSNTATTVTLESAPQTGKYVVLPDFPQSDRLQQEFIVDIRTISGAGFIDNLVVSQNNSLLIAEFEENKLANMLFRDGAGDLFIIKSNTSTRINFYETSTPSINSGMLLFPRFNNSEPVPYFDTFRTVAEATARVGSTLRENRFYYYTVFTKPVGTNVAQAEFGNIDSGVSTQDHAISTRDNQFGDLLYGTMWPTLHRELDSTGDLQDLMKVFGFQFNELHSLIATYKLQDSDNVLVTALLPLSEQTGLPTVGFSIGADTLRRVARDMISCWKLKGSKEGIALFIRKITTWDITNGTADFSAAISDFLPNVEALRFFDPNLGSLNTRITQTDPFVAGGRFARTLPGIVIPGFFTFREFVIDIPDVALFIGASEGFTVGSNSTTMLDTSQNFGTVNGLVGNFLVPNTEEVNDIFEIISNTSNSITVRGVINNRAVGGDYAILSPLNTNRFIILNSLLPVFIPFGTKAGFRFIINP
jgi:hypothetical protein